MVNFEGDNLVGQVESEPFSTAEFRQQIQFGPNWSNLPLVCGQNESMSDSAISRSLRSTTNLASVSELDRFRDSIGCAIGIYPGDWTRRDSRGAGKSPKSVGDETRRPAGQTAVPLVSGLGQTYLAKKILKARIGTQAIQQKVRPDPASVERLLHAGLL